jgi:kinesin family protein 5
VEVFEEVKGVVDSVMSGFNGTVMAYGQTSAGSFYPPHPGIQFSFSIVVLCCLGKSWTMDGASIWERETQGVIPRCVDALFDCIQRADNNIQFTVIISFYEVLVIFDEIITSHSFW